MLANLRYIAACFKLTQTGCGRGVLQILFALASLKILVSDASDKMSGVFGLGSDIFEMMSGGLGYSLW